MLVSVNSSPPRPRLKAAILGRNNVNLSKAALTNTCHPSFSSFFITSFSFRPLISRGNGSQRLYWQCRSQHGWHSCLKADAVSFGGFTSRLPSTSSTWLTPWQDTIAVQYQTSTRRPLFSVPLKSYYRGIGVAIVMTVPATALYLTSREVASTALLPRLGNGSLNDGQRFLPTH